MELVFESPTEGTIANAIFIKEAMERKIEGLDIPIVAECAVALRWGQKKDLEFDNNGGAYVYFGKDEMEEPKQQEFIRRLKLANIQIKLKEW